MGRAPRAAVATAVALACLLPVTPASAGTVEDVVTGEHLRLVSVTSPEMASLSPGQTATWDVGVSVTTPGDASVDVAVQVLSAPSGAFEMEVSRCSQRWTTAGCSSGAVPLATAPLTTGASTAVDSTDADGAPWYRIAVTMVGGSSGAAATLRLIADGVGEELSTDGGAGAPPSTGGLPVTGASGLGQVVLASPLRRPV